MPETPHKNCCFGDALTHLSTQHYGSCQISYFYSFLLFPIQLTCYINIPPLVASVMRKSILFISPLSGFYVIANLFMALSSLFFGTVLSWTNNLFGQVCCAFWKCWRRWSYVWSQHRKHTVTVLKMIHHFQHFYPGPFLLMDRIGIWQIVHWWSTDGPFFSQSIQNLILIFRFLENV